MWAKGTVVAEDLTGEDLSDVLQLHTDASAWWVLPRDPDYGAAELRGVAHALDLDDLAVRDLQPLHGALVGADHRRDQQLQAHLDPALGQQLGLLQQEPGGLEPVHVAHEADEHPVGGDDRDRVHRQVARCRVVVHIVGDHQPGAADGLELGPAVGGQQVADGQLVEVQRVRHVAQLGRPVVGVAGQHPPGRGVAVVLQDVAEVLTDQVLGDDPALGPDPAQRDGARGHSAGHVTSLDLSAWSGGLPDRRPVGEVSCVQALSEVPLLRRFSQASTTRLAMPASATLPQARGS